MGAEGLFFAKDPKLQNLKIFIRSDYKTYDDLTISTILIHGLTHVGQYIDETINKTKSDCFDNEAEAFLAQATFLSQLNKEETLSIYAKTRESINTNPAFKIIQRIEQALDEAYDTCITLKKENNLIDQQFIQCVWTGIKNKLEVEIKADPYYQEQCRYNSSRTN